MITFQGVGPKENTVFYRIRHLIAIAQPRGEGDHGPEKVVHLTEQDILDLVQFASLPQLRLLTAEEKNDPANWPLGDDGKRFKPETMDEAQCWITGPKETK